MYTEQQELLKSQMSAEDQTNSNSSEELLKRKTLTTNGIQVVGSETMGYFAAIGRFRISEIYKTPEEIEKLVEEKDWEIIGGLVGAITEGLAETMKKMAEIIEIMAEKKNPS